MGQLEQGGKLGLAHLGTFGSGSTDPAGKPSQTLGIKEITGNEGKVGILRVLEALPLDPSPSLLVPAFISQDHRVVEAGRSSGECFSMSPSKQCHPKLFHRVPKDFGHLQGWRFHRISSMSYLCPLLPGVTSGPRVTFRSLHGRKRTKEMNFWE